MKSFTRFLGLVLALTLCGPLSACSGSEKDAETEAVSAQQPQGPSENAEKAAAEVRIHPDLEIRDFDGKTFRIFSCAPNEGNGWYVHDMTAEEMTGSVLNDAVFTRNAFLADTYNFTIEVEISPEQSPVSEVEALVASADTTYDTFGLRSYTIAPLSLDGNLLDLAALPELSLDKTWWNPALCEPLSVAGHRYMASGDITVVIKEGVRAFYFNKGLLGDYRLESPYELVDAGAWTCDKMFSMMHTAAQDLNGDGKMGREDRWGLQGQNITGIVLYYGSGESMISEDEEGLWRVTAGDERSVGALLKVSELMKSSENEIYLTDDWQSMLKMFENNQALFYTEVMLHIETMRGYEVDFGIIPTPKLDDAQDGYAHFLDSFCTVFYALPVTHADPSSAAYLLEVIAYASHFDITPAYYDICLKSKYSRDEESSKMLDVIFDSCRMEIGDIYGIGVYGAMKLCLRDGGNVASTLASQGRLAEKLIEKKFQQFREKNGW